MALVASPQWLDTGDNAWQLAAATFVGLQSIPGLTVLYGGIVKKKWAINSAFMSMYAFASVLVVWVLFDYNMAFGPQWLPFLGHAESRDIGRLHDRSGDHSRGGVRHAAARLSDGDAHLLPVRVRRDHRHHPGGLGSRPDELHRLDDLLPGVDDARLYCRGVQPLGRRLARRPWRRGLLGRLCHPSRRRNLGLRRRLGRGPKASGRPRPFPAEQPSDHAGRRRHPVARLERLQRRRPLLRQRRRRRGGAQHQHRDRGRALWCGR